MKVLVTYVPAGSGHQKAAEALTAALREESPSDRVELLDALEGADRAYRWSFTRGYLQMVDRLPVLWGAGYHATDFIPLRKVICRLHRLQNAWHGKKLERLLLEAQPDAVVATHFFPAEVTAFLKSRRKLQSRLITVITDYLPHLVWTANSVDLYAVGSDATRTALIERGVASQRIQVTGIPADLKFSAKQDPSLLKKRLGLKPERPTLLIGSGGFGNGPVVALVNHLDRLKLPIQLVVIAGHNESLYQALQAASARWKHPMTFLRFVDNMDEWMGASDLMVTKPGGLTCTEALLKGLPLVLLSTLSGQEESNAEVLSGLGLALTTRRVEEAPRLVERLLKDAQRRRRMAESGKAFSRPGAARTIARLALIGKVACDG